MGVGLSLQKVSTALASQLKASQVGKYAIFFKNPASSKDMTEWEPSLPEGSHRVAMTLYGAVESSKNKSVPLEVEFVSLETHNRVVQIGALPPWPWFVNAPGEFTGSGRW